MVVLGLSQTEDLRALKAALTAGGLSLEELDTVGPDDETAPNLAGDAASTRIITSGGGTGVPGLNSNDRTTLDVDAIVDRLGDFGIPDAEIDNYVEAVERGKTVVGYFAKPDDVTKVTAAFNTANLSNVRTFSET
jgi:hypothetical protein